MARVCHLNTCPVGVTSQLMRLRQKFPGNPDHIVQYFKYVADEVRSVLASLGKKSLGEVVGDMSVLEARDAALGKVSKTKNVKADVLLKGSVAKFVSHRNQPAHSVAAGEILDDQLLKKPEIVELLKAAGTDASPMDVKITSDVCNTDRTV